MVQDSTYDDGSTMKQTKMMTNMVKMEEDDHVMIMIRILVMR